MSAPGATGPASNEGNVAAPAAAKQEFRNTGFEISEEIKELLARTAATKQQNEVLRANSASAKQSEQRAGPNTGNTAAQLSANTAPPVNALRAVPIAHLPPVPRKREWLHGNDLMRGAVSMLSAPGARAKTTWLLTCALACASGRSLLGAHVFGGPLRVLYLSAEDSTDEIALRVRAAMQHHGLSNADASGLYVIGADKWGLSLLSTEGGAPRLAPPGWNALVAELNHIKPDVLIIDPLINVMGGVDVSNNSAAALLIGQLATLATQGRRIAVMIAHHVAKGRDPASAEAAMGAASFVNLSRIALTIERLEEKQAGQIGVPSWKAKSIFRVFGTKQNYSSPDADDRWFQILTVEIQNQQPPIYVTGDQVAVIAKFDPGSSRPAFPAELIRDVLLALDAADPPLSSAKQSGERYAVPVIAQAIAPHRGGRADDTEGKNVLDYVLRRGLVRIEDVKLSRAGSRADTRKGLVLTLAGKEAIKQDTEVASNPPQSPQSPAV
jgi:hypothetical protein